MKNKFEYCIELNFNLDFEEIFEFAGENINKYFNSIPLGKLLNTKNRGIITEDYAEWCRKRRNRNFKKIVKFPINK